MSEINDIEDETFDLPPCQKCKGPADILENVNGISAYYCASCLLEEMNQ